MHNRFAVVKLWPDIKTAEDECIARIKIAALALGIECVEIYSDGRLIENPEKKISNQNTDFVIHLHYDTPKNYDCFSFVALWNPYQFYGEWGISRCNRNLTTHDDFLSCRSIGADSHIRRLIKDDLCHLEPEFELFHSLPKLEYSAFETELPKLFYVGINWEAVSGKTSRHQELLKKLDNDGLTRIYGPKLFQGVNVWDGYRTYVKEIPFDGISLLKEINESGVALVLSSEAHKEAGLMSNRLFEAIAAGAIVICDENNFARENFGDSLLYIDTRLGYDKCYQDIKEHLKWISDNLNLAREKVRASQAIFETKYSISNCLSNIYSQLPARKEKLQRWGGVQECNDFVTAIYIISNLRDSSWSQILQTIKNQTYKNTINILIVPSSSEQAHLDQLDYEINTIGINAEIRVVDFHERDVHGNLISGRKIKFGRMLSALVNSVETDFFLLVSSYEQILSNHIGSLCAVAKRNQAWDVVASAVIVVENGKDVHQVSEVIDLNANDLSNHILGSGRFLFKKSRIEGDISILLDELDAMAINGLIGLMRLGQIPLSTLSINKNDLKPNIIVPYHIEKGLIREYYKKELPLYVGLINYDNCTQQNLLTYQDKNYLQKLFDFNWILLQINAMRRVGLLPRLSLLSKKVF